MPASIYQNRIIRLVEAAELYISRDYAFRSFCTSTINRFYADQISANEALTTIATRLSQSPSYDAAERVVREERVRYELTARRNDMERERQRARRAGVEYIPPMAEPIASKNTRLATAKQHSIKSRSPAIQADSNVETNYELIQRTLDDTGEVDFEITPTETELERIEREYYENLTPTQKAEVDRLMAKRRSEINE